MTAQNKLTISDSERKRIRQLENESIYILRETFAQLPQLVLLWSMGKDSTVLLWLTRKAFFGRVPFPVLHIDTQYKIPEMLVFRQTLAQKWGLDLIVESNNEALAQGMGPHQGRLKCCTALKTEALKAALKKHNWKVVFAAIRRDEEGSRGKEKIFSLRDRHSHWNYKEQEPEFWQEYLVDLKNFSEMRVHPLLNWRELDVWMYIQEEEIPFLDLYLSRSGQRYRSVGCAPCTQPIASSVKTLDEMIQELRNTRTGERVGRSQDQEERYAMQKLRSQGYM